MKKTFISGFILCFIGTFSMSSIAQEYKNFDLSKYYTPDIVRNQLDLSGSSAGVFNSSSGTSNSFYQLDQSQDNNINGNLNAAFINYKSTRKLIRTINANMSLSGAISNSNELTTRANRQDGGFYNIAGIGTSYQLFNPTNKFLSFGGDIGYGYRSGSGYQTDSLKKADRYSNNRLNAGLNAYIGVGIGRIENVTDAQQAAYLIEAFTKNNVLDRDLSTNEIFSLSQEISRVKNKRFLDARLHLMDEVSHVDSFFVANNLIKKSDANYFTTLYDIWMYGDKFERKAGQSIELRFAPSARIDNSYNKSTYEISNNTDSEKKEYHLNAAYYLSLIYNYEKPLSQKWQHSVNASLEGRQSNVDNTYKSLLPQYDDGKSATSYKYAQANASYKIGFYPNTRTNLYAQISQHIGYDFYASSISNGYTQVDKTKSLSGSTNLDLGTYYYFSPQLRLTANVQLSNAHGIYDIYDITGRSLTYNTFNSNFSVGVNYSFF
jgi:hypothetical protein